MVKKKNIRKTALFLCVVCLALSLVSCNAFNKAESTPSEPSEVKADTSIKVYKIGLLQFSENETQNIIRDALMSRIEEWGYNSERVNINPKNAKGSAEEAENICRQFVSSKVDLIIAISPEASKAAAKAIENTDVGLIFADTGDVKSTLGMDISAAPVKNITGVTVLHPVNNVLDFALTVNPELKTVGVIYNHDNIVSVSSLNSLKEYCTSKEI